MDASRSGHVPLSSRFEAHPLRCLMGQPCHAVTMAGQTGSGQVGEVAHGREGLVNGRAGEHQRVTRLAREYDVPQGLLTVGHQLVGMGAELLRDVGIMSPAGARPDNVDGVLLTTDPPLDRRIPRDSHDAQRKGDGIALQAKKAALAVPTLGELPEQAVDRCGKTEALAQHLGDLAHRGHVCGMAAHRPRQRPGDLERPREPAGLRVGDRANDPTNDLARAAVDRGVEVLQHRAPREQLGRDLSVGGAADVVEQAAVEGLRGNLVVDAKAAGEPGGDDRALQAVLKRQSHR